MVSEQGLILSRSRYVPCECPECDVRHNGRAVADESSQGGRAGPPGLPAAERVRSGAQEAGRLSTGVSVCAGRFRRCLLSFAKNSSVNESAQLCSLLCGSCRSATHDRVRLPAERIYDGGRQADLSAARHVACGGTFAAGTPLLWPLVAIEAILRSCWAIRSCPRMRSFATVVLRRPKI